MQSGDIISNGWAGQEPVETDDVHEDYGTFIEGLCLRGKWSSTTKRPSMPGCSGSRHTGLASQMEGDGSQTTGGL